MTLLQGQAKEVEKNAEPTAKDAAKNIKDVAQKVRHCQGSANTVTLHALFRLRMYIGFPPLQMPAHYSLDERQAPTRRTDGLTHPCLRLKAASLKCQERAQQPLAM